jgi:periplasmic divalent cation tolerance protein
MQLSLGYITAGSKKEAQDMVGELLERRLIACANILDGAESYFEWEGELQKAKETIIFLKTRASNEAKIIKVISKIHSYDVPCIVFTPLISGHGDFLNWVGESC